MLVLSTIRPKPTCILRSTQVVWYLLFNANSFLSPLLLLYLSFTVSKLQSFSFLTPTTISSKDSFKTSDFQLSTANLYLFKRQITISKLLTFSFLPPTSISSKDSFKNSDFQLSNANLFLFSPSSLLQVSLNLNCK